MNSFSSSIEMAMNLYPPETINLLATCGRLSRTGTAEQAETLDDSIQTRVTRRILTRLGRGALQTLENEGAGARSIASDRETARGGREFSAARCQKGRRRCRINGWRRGKSDLGTWVRGRGWRPALRRRCADGGADVGSLRQQRCGCGRRCRWAICG
jgi:hypothetical protein